MVRLFILLAAVQLVLLILALISCLSADRVRNAPRVVWVLVILLIPLIGPLAYFVTGRPRPRPKQGGPLRRRSRPASPDDDPDFLRSMDTEQSRRDREALTRWENELRKGKEQPNNGEEDSRNGEPEAR